MPHTPNSVLRDNGLSIAFGVLFLGAIAAQSITGLISYNGDRAAAGLSPLSYPSFLASGTFLDGVFSNCQAAILQLTVLILFGTVLRQRGAAHSRESDGRPAYAFRFNLRLQESFTGWLYCNSLSLAFIGTFLLFFALHVVFGSWSNNEQRLLRHLSPMTTDEYFWSSTFWFSVMQTWEAEFFAMGFYLILSIFLRQIDSPESKTVSAGNDATGETYH
ncbi:MAG: hypothetical protein JSR99_14425 [Proteobacteria bacterium]|nr:hypothetical protein [Pseudomonadota bacterium]